MTREQERLVEEHLSLVRAIVRSRYWGIVRVGMFELDDLIQVGCLGLMRAAERYDPAQGHPFKALASVCITRRIQHELVAANRKCRRGRLSEVSLDAPVRPDAETPLGELLAAQGDVADAALRTMALERARDELGEDWRLVEMRYEVGLNGREIGEEIGLSCEGARLRVNNALARARALLAEVM